MNARAAETVSVPRASEKAMAFFGRRDRSAAATVSATDSDEFSPLWSNSQLMAGALGGRVLRLALPIEWLALMELEPGVTRLLSRLNGRSTIEEVVVGCGLQPESAMRVLREMVDEGVVRARG